MKFGSKSIAIGLLVVGLVLVNYLASSVPVRVDATAESIYSLSDGTRRMLGPAPPIDPGRAGGTQVRARRAPAKAAGLRRRHAGLHRAAARVRAGAHNA